MTLPAIEVGSSDPLNGDDDVVLERRSQAHAIGAPMAAGRQAVGDDRVIDDCLALLGVRQPSE